MRPSPLPLVLVALCACRSQTVPDTDASTDAPAVDAPDVTDAPAPDVAPDVTAPAECGAGSSAALMACVREADLVADLARVASPRPPGSDHHDAVRDLCAERLTSLGFTVERHDYGTGVNVVGVRPGTDPAAPRVIVSAHYDHIAGCAGADDNGSGVVGALEVARVLSQARFTRTLVVACWDEEERGLIGSRAYAQRAMAAGESIAAAFVFEMIGYRSTEPDSQRLPAGLNLVFPRQAAQVRENNNRGDFIALIADETARDHTTAMERAAMAVSLPTITLSLTRAQTGSPLYGDLQRSDHASFWAAGYPAIQITDTAEFRNARYHCRGGADTPDTLDGDFMGRVVQVTVGAAADALGLAP